MSNTTKLYHVYTLVNAKNEIEYIGCSVNLQKRYSHHVHERPTNNSGHGMFYKRKDLKINCIKSFIEKKDALKFEGELKIQNGFEWTERGNRNGKRGGGDIEFMKMIAQMGVNTAPNNHRIKLIMYDYSTKAEIGEFNSITEVSKKFNLNAGNVSRVLNKKVNHTGGYYFEYKK